MDIGMEGSSGDLDLSPESMSEDMREGLEAVAAPNRHDLAALPPFANVR